MNGQNFLIRLADAKPKKMGFYRSVFVEASDPLQAELLAVEAVRDSNLTDIVVETVDDPPVIYLEEIYELEEDDELPESAEEHGFYLEKRWWQFGNN